ALQRAGATLREAARRVSAHPQIRLPPRRQRADGAGRADGSRRSVSRDSGGGNVEGGQGGKGCQDEGEGGRQGRGEGEEGEDEEGEDRSQGEGEIQRQE